MGLTPAALLLSTIPKKQNHLQNVWKAFTGLQCFLSSARLNCCHSPGLASTIHFPQDCIEICDDDQACSGNDVCVLEAHLPNHVLGDLSLLLKY